MHRIIAAAALAAITVTPIASIAPPALAAEPGSPGERAAQAAKDKTAKDKAAAEAARLAELKEMKQLGSYYLRCDGQPNNVTGGEDFARLIGAVTLLAIFAPEPETPDPAKRLFAEKGVDACSRLLDDPKEETNKVRRIPLILARALHHIEARSYTAALIDVDKARAEAKAAGLSGNVYFDRSLGFSFDQIESVIHLRLDDPAKAEEVSLRSLSGTKFGLVQLFTAETYDTFLQALSPAREQQLQALGRMYPATFIYYASRLEDVGRFADAARYRELLIATVDDEKPEFKGSLPYALAALDHALTGDIARATAREGDASANMDSRIAAGKAEDSAAAVIETLDLLGVVKLAAEGKLAEARRTFAARSQWLSASLGTVMEVNRRLRAGAPRNALFGALAKTPEALWAQRRDKERIRRNATDSDNKALFTNIYSLESIKDFESTSKAVWRTDKSRLMFKEPMKRSGHWMIFSPGGGLAGLDGVMLHAALLARARGKQGFVMNMHVSQPPYGEVSFVDAGDAGVSPERYLDAEAVIAEMSSFIPSPAMLAQRKAPAKQ